MSNPNDRYPSKREVYTDADGDIHTRDRHRDSYVNDREIEEERFFLNQRVRRTGPGSGLFIGIALAALLGVGVVVWYLLSQSSNEPTQQIIVPEAAPTVPQAPASPPEVDITVPSVEVPQAPQAPSPPNVDITVPSVEVPQAPQSPSSQNNSNTTTPSSQPNTTNTTPTSPSNSSTTNPTDNSINNSTDSE